MKKKSLDTIEKIHKSPLSKAWKTIGIFDHHGINIPLFSLHSNNSCGIGEFLDLKLLIDFCKCIRFDIIQLLPLNDSGYENSPYNAISSKALNPIYLSLKALPYCQSDGELARELGGFNKYTHLQRIAYNAVLNAKMDFLRLYYKKYFPLVQNSPAYKTFIKKNPWLYSYGLFKMLKEGYAHRKWSSWPSKHRNLSKTLKKNLLLEKKAEIDFYIFLQFLCFSQMEEVKGYAEKNGVFLKGDIPILVSSESVDVWDNPGNFDLHFSAGAPPDEFCKKGQNWGFPIYNWTHVELSDYLFWKDRLQIAACFYHLYRIDHIIGLYRIFARDRKDPHDKGCYIPSDPNLALCQGSRIIEKLISLTGMLPIGEDLGVVDPSFKENMTFHTLPGTKVPFWEKIKNTYIHGKDYPPISLTTVSTHDSESLTLWWNNHPEEAKHFASCYQIEYQPTLSPSTRYKILKDSHHSASLFHINLLPEYLSLFEDLTWDDPREERINLPGTVLPSNWCYRTRPSLEFILRHDSLKAAMKTLIS